MLPETTPLRGHDEGEGWHLEPRRRYLFGAAALVGAVVLVLLARAALGSGAWPAAVICLLLAACAVGAVVEPQRRREPRMHESESSYGLLLPVRPIKLSVAVAFLVIGLCGLATPVGFLVAGLHGELEGRQYAGAVFGSVVGVALGILFLAAAWTWVEALRAPSRGVLLSVDGIELRTQTRPASVPWHGVRAVRAHWRRIRPRRDLFRSWEDPIDNWFTLDVDPDLAVGATPVRAFARVEGLTFDAARIAMDPELALAVCRFYLVDAEARGELRTTAALDRVASLARSPQPMG